MPPDVPTGYPVLSGETLVVPILGDPIAQVKSPDGVTRALVARGHDAVVVPMHVLADDLDTVVRGLGSVRSVAGLIATVPHKFGLAAHAPRSRTVPRSSARRIMLIAGRSLTEPAGLLPSSLPRMTLPRATLAAPRRRTSRTIGVAPITSSIVG